MKQEKYYENFVAIPDERVAPLQDVISKKRNIRVTGLRSSA